MSATSYIISRATKLLPRRWAYKVISRLPYSVRSFDTIILFHGAKLKISTDESVGKILYWMDEYKPVHTHFMESLLGPGISFWDFGANIGMYDALALKNGAHTIAFE